MARILSQPLPALLDMDVMELAWWMAQTAETIEQHGGAFGLHETD